MRRNFILIICLLMFLSFQVFAEKIPIAPFVMPTAASNGMGGHHVAYTDNVFSLLVNPAAMIRTQQRSFFTLAPTLFNPQSTIKLGKSITDLAQGDTGALGTAADTLSKQKGRIALGLELREFPLSFAWVANGFGFGLWNRTYVNANIIGTSMNVTIFEDAMLPIGFAFRIVNFENHSLDLGLTVKPFARVMASTSEKITNLISGDDDFIDSLNVPVIMGGTFDIGLLYRWDIGLSAGLTFNDIYSRGKAIRNINSNVKDKNSYYIPFTMDAGLAFDFKLLKFMGFTLAADWRDFGNAFSQKNYLNRNSLLDLGLGFQFSLIDIFKFRIGLSEMLPSAGIGFDIGPVEIDFAYYGRELGNEPGQLSAAMVEFSFSIRPGAKKRNWPWARRSLVGLFTGIEKVESEEE